jgi:hypothetical protein
LKHKETGTQGCPLFMLPLFGLFGYAWTQNRRQLAHFPAKYGKIYKRPGSMNTQTGWIMPDSHCNKPK